MEEYYVVFLNKLGVKTFTTYDSKEEFEQCKKEFFRKFGYDREVVYEGYSEEECKKCVYTAENDLACITAMYSKAAEELTERLDDLEKVLTGKE